MLKLKVVGIRGVKELNTKFEMQMGTADGNRDFAIRVFGVPEAVVKAIETGTEYEVTLTPVKKAAGPKDV